MVLVEQERNPESKRLVLALPLVSSNSFLHFKFIFFLVCSASSLSICIYESTLCLQRLVNVTYLVSVCELVTRMLEGSQTINHPDQKEDQRVLMSSDA